MDKAFEKRKKVVYDLMCDSLYTPMKFKELAMLLQVPKEKRDELRQILEALEAEGKIYLSKRGKYCKGEAKKLTGVYRGNLKGFGFILMEDESPDVFVAEENINGAFDGDTVEFTIVREPEGKSREGKITRIVERGLQKVVGLYQMKPGKSYGFVIPDDQKILKDIFIPIEKSKGAVNGHKVLVELTSYGDDRHKPEGVVEEIIGHVNDPGVDILSIVKAYDLPVEFPQKVLNQAERVAKPVSEADKAGRKDLRDWQMVTIDGEDAKDLDDAVSVVKEGEHYVLGVHIADVTNYVQENSALDREAYERGTSVYLVDRVIPMLPHTLSNGMCSLNAGEDRLALSCIMTVDEEGVVVDHEIAETVIHVNERMTYTSVRKILADHDEEECKKYKDFVPMFEQMAELSAILRKRRKKRGSIDFDFPESKIILNAAGKAIDVKPYEANVATKIIEDFMLMANETVAQEYCTEEIPFVYRTHDNPDPEKVESLLTLLHNQGVKIQKAKEEITPKEIQQIIESIEGLPNEAMISRLVLRSMKQAKYTTECRGHFGLAAKYYCHFTSPIRRYPDLQIHRIIKDNLRGRLMREGRTEHYAEILDEVARQSSVCERRADEAERESDKLKKAEYMSYHLGEEFEGIISGVTGWGLYVELPNTVEGLVHVNTLRDDYYVFDQESYELRGEMTKKVYKLGDKVRVRVAEADKMLKTVDFELVSDIRDDEEEN